MKNHKLILLIVAFVFCVQYQVYSRNKRMASVPFELVGSYVVVKASINNSQPLTFIIDTGVRNTIITELQKDDSLHLQKEKNDTTSIKGLGSEDKIQALRSFGNNLKIGKIGFSSKTVLLILNHELFNLSQIIGKSINGILGTDIFRDYIVEINYNSSYIHFYKKESFTVPKSYTQIPVEKVNNNMFIHADLTFPDNKSKRVKMLIDTGAEIGAWLQKKNEKDTIAIPEKKVYGYLGEGLSGEILGNYAYINSLCIGDFCLKKPLITFPDSVYINDEYISNRDGTLGNQVMKRFNCIFDFSKPAMYLKPNQMFNEKFRYNIAGIEIVRGTNNILNTVVNKVWKNSTADKEGVKEGDLMLEINGEQTFTMSLSEIRDLFERSRRFPLHVILMRNGEIIDVSLNMNPIL